MLAASVRVKGSRVCYVRIGNGSGGRDGKEGEKYYGGVGKAGGHGATEEDARG